MEAHRRAELLHEIAHLGTAQQHIERTSRPAPLSTDKMFHHGFLLRRHLVVLEGLEAVPHELHVARVGRRRLRGGERGNQTNDN